MGANVLTFVVTTALVPSPGGLSQLGRGAVVRAASAAAVGGLLAAVPAGRALAEEVANPFSGATAKQGLNYGSRPQGLGSEGISSYEKMKLDEATANLADAAKLAAGDAALSPALGAYAKALPLVSTSTPAAPLLGQVDGARLEAASGALADLSRGNDSLGKQAEALGKSTAKLVSSCARNDGGGAAVAAIALADQLTDFTYEWSATPKPEVLKEITGQPPLRALADWEKP